MSDSEMFKTTLMGGYDKDDVMEQIRKLKDAHAGEVGRLTKEIQQKNSRIEELTHRLVTKKSRRKIWNRRSRRNIRNILITMTVFHA